MRIMIVDDDTFIVESLVTILGAQPDIEIAATAHGGREAAHLYAEVTPDVLLIDIRMPEGDGLAAAELILGSDPAARIVFLTTFTDDEYIVRALRLGARGYLIKQDVAAIAPALRSVMAGQNVLGGEVMDRMPFLGTAQPAARSAGAPGQVSEPEAQPDLEPAAPFACAAQPDPKPASQPAARSAGAAQPEHAPSFPTAFADGSATVQLSEREQRIVELVAQGYDNKEIARTIYISEGTVRNHISSILAKLALKNRTQIAVRYWQSRAH